MKIFGFTLLALLMTAPSLVRAQTKTDLETLRKIPQDFCDAWAKHDGHALAQIMADDVDFVTVGGTLIHGRSDFETYRRETRRRVARDRLTKRQFHARRGAEFSGLTSPMPLPDQVGVQPSNPK